MKTNLLPFITEKWAGVPQPIARFDGKTVIVTGANTGLGYEAALKFVALGAAKVILGVRNMPKGALACRQIEEETQRKGIVDSWELDMGRYSSIQQFANRAGAELQRLDVVMLNAGVASKEFTIGHEGWQSTLQVNVLGTALLALLLLPKLKLSKTSTDTSRLVIVTSEAHRWVESTDIPDTGPYGGSILQALNAQPADKATWNGLDQMAKSKLLAMYVARSLAALATQPSGEIDVIVSTVMPWSLQIGTCTRIRDWICCFRWSPRIWCDFQQVCRRGCEGIRLGGRVRSGMPWGLVQDHSLDNVSYSLRTLTLYLQDLIINMIGQESS